MPSQTVRKRLDQIPAAVRVAFAASEVVGEAVRRSSASRRSGTMPRETACLGAPLSRHCHAVGIELVRRGQAMFRADLVLDGARAGQRRAIARRQELLEDLRADMVEVRRQVHCMLGRKDGSQFFRYLAEETARDPDMLYRQARALAPVLRSPKTAPRPRLRGWKRDWTETSEILAAKSAALEQAIRDVHLERRRVQLMMRNQRRAIERFDEVGGWGPRYLERTLDMVGLPSLADQVRPGVGRRGRPRKVERVDAYPDLVEEAFRLAGLPASGEDPAETRGESSPEAASGGCPQDLSGARNGRPEAVSGAEKIERGLRKLPGRRRKIVHGLRNLFGSEKKIEQGLRKLPDAGEKSRRGLRKSSAIGVNVERSAVRKDRRPRGRRLVLGLRNAGARRQRRSRPEAAQPEAPPRVASIRTIRATASAWWGRLRRAA